MIHRLSLVRTWVIFLFFGLLSLLMLWPLSLNLSTMVPEPTDPLLNAWRMQWNAHAFLSGPESLTHIFNTNIFYPFPLTLAYSEHFLIISAQALPFLLLADSHLFSVNLSVLLTFVLSGYGMYLLITAWTGQRWAGLVAGILFAFSPQRFGQLNHLELLVTQWLPLTLLALHWTLTRPGKRYPLLFILFFNLQALSGFHFTLNLTIACAFLALIYTIFGWTYWRRDLWLVASLAIGFTFLLNWPIWRMYLRFSDMMGAVRTPGEVRVYSAALTDYLTTIPHNLLYGWTFGRWQAEGHQFQPLMPLGVVGLLLAVVGLRGAGRSGFVNPDQDRERKTGDSLSAKMRATPLPLTFFLILLTLIGLLLSFGLNENALGPGLAPLLRYSPYRWLYDHIFIFQGIRVPGRYSILALLGLVGLAGQGLAYLRTTYYAPPLITNYHAKRPITLLLPLLILLEYWSAPLIGPEFPAGQIIPPVYNWLREETPPETIILELPFQGPSEFLYEYYASHHWRRLANGGTGFTPPIYKDLRQIFNAFPDPRSVDIIQQLGLNLVILHPAAYTPEEWQRIQTDLPLYLPAIDQIKQIGDALVLQIARPTCFPLPERVTATLSPAVLDGLINTVTLTYHNAGPAAFVADVRQGSRLTLTDGSDKNFTEPLVTPAGETQAVIVPLPEEQTVTEAWLATLRRTIAADASPVHPLTPTNEPGEWQPLGLQFTEGPQLVAYRLPPTSPSVCGVLPLTLKWAGDYQGYTALVQLLDPFGRVVQENRGQLMLSEDSRQLALVGSLPPGRYGLRIRLLDAAGQERWPITGDGVPIPPEQVPPLPLIIQPASPPSSNALPLAEFGGRIQLLAGEVASQEVAAGDWLRFTLLWQSEQRLDTDWTVFTQLLGPDGQVWGQRDNQPGGGWYGTSLWPPGQPVRDDYAFQIQAEAPPGTYRLIAGLYDSQTLERLTTETGADFVEIGTVVVE